MNIHLVPDEKFIDTFIEIAEHVCSPGENVYLVRGNKPFKLVKSPNVIEAPLESLVLSQYMQQATAADKVYIHYLGMDVCEWLGKTETKAALLWVFWGSEFFEMAGVAFDLFEPLTEAYIKKTRNEDVPLSRFKILHHYRGWKRKQQNNRVQAEKRAVFGKTVARLSYILHYNSYDFDLIKKHFPTKAKYQYYNYPPPYSFKEIDQNINAVESPFEISASDLNVWLGNSGYPANNHLDYIAQMAHMDIDQLKVWAPLNYGNADYIQHIIDTGHKHLHSKFKAITEYMSFDSFMRVIYAMDISIMPHKRAQAFGNIQLLLYFGKKIYMDENTLYRFLLERGYHIYSVEDITAESLRTPMTEEEIAHNRELIDKEFSKEVSYQHFATCLHLP